MKQTSQIKIIRGYGRSLFLALSLLGTASFLSSCHDDPVYEETLPGEDEDTRVINISLPENHFAIGNENTAVSISLISADGITQVFDANVERVAGKLRLKMIIPDDVYIANGKYVMTMRHENGRSITGRVSCVFEKESLSDVRIILPSYMLPGSGTEEDPYVIADDSDFEMFLINLSDDTDSYGAGLKFLQTADVTAPDQSSLIPGRGYWGAPFAGIYDGGGHSIKGLYYHGSGRENSDSGFGIFNKLIGSATIENLSVTDVNVSGLYKESGMIAGFVSGDIAFRNIYLSGNIQGGYSLGCLAGLVSGGSLVVDNVQLCASVSGKDNVGGLIGKVNTGAHVTVSNVSTPKGHFSVSGNSRVGGIVGETASPSSFRNIRIEHKVTNEDSDLRIISGAGDGTGGIIGAVTHDPKGIELSDCYVLCPLGGKDANSVGGVIGKLECLDIQISNSRIYSVVSGKTYVGGIIGQGKIPHSAKGLQIGGDDYSVRVAVDDADASVSGRDYVGGFAGWWEGPLDIKSKIKINVPVSSSGSACGGAIGGAYNSTVDATRFLIGSGNSGANTLHISGSAETGGIIGRLWESTLKGGSTFDFATEGDDAILPKPDQFEPVFNGVVTGTVAVGGIVGYALKAEIKGICSAAHITGTREVGGVVGKVEDETYTKSIVEDCTFRGILDCSAADMVGGIVGHYRSVGVGLVHDCVNYSDIVGGDTDGGSAGIVGYVSKSKLNDDGKILEIKWCANTGKVTGGMHVGGIVGRANAEDSYTKTGGPDTKVAISIADCVNTGSIWGEGGAIGGILGFSNYLSGVCRCANHGRVFGLNVSHGIGGIAGSMGQDPTGAGLTTLYRNMLLQQCFNNGEIDAGSRDSFVGGILGYQEEGEDSNVEDCANHGRIVPDQNHDSGGIVGCVDHLTNIYRCVNKGKVEHGNAAIGTHKSACIFSHDHLYYLDGTGKGWPSATKLSSHDFIDESKYKGLDFANVWKMTSEGPMLRHNRWNYIKTGNIKK